MKRSVGKGEGGEVERILAPATEKALSDLAAKSAAAGKVIAVLGIDRTGYVFTPLSNALLKGLSRTEGGAIAVRENAQGELVIEPIDLDPLALAKASGAKPQREASADNSRLAEMLEGDATEPYEDAIPPLTLNALKMEATEFAGRLDGAEFDNLYGVTDGKAIGTFIEKSFNEFLKDRYDYQEGNAAKGVDFPELGVDLKTTSITQPQSSGPFTAASEKVYGFPYDLIIFVYDKQDDQKRKTTLLVIKRVVFLKREFTGDNQTTAGLQMILANGGGKQEVENFLKERELPVNEYERSHLAEDIVAKPPQVGYLTISPALQWRLQYKRVYNLTGDNEFPGVEKLY